MLKVNLCRIVYSSSCFQINAIFQGGQSYYTLILLINTTLYNCIAPVFLYFLLTDP